MDTDSKTKAPANIVSIKWTGLVKNSTLRSHMHFWRQDRFKSLQEFIKDADKFPEWSDYFAYCEHLERGLRKEAFAKLDGFISSLLTMSFEERRRFVSWLYNRVWNSGWLNTFVPHPLQTRLTDPTLIEWVERQPDAAEPHCWLGTAEHLRRSVALDPQNEVACRRLISCILSGMGYAIHELPAFYLGDDPLEDLADLATAGELLTNVYNPDDRTQFAARITEVKKLLEEYIRSQEAA